MTTQHSQPNFATLNQETHDIWNQNAALWDQQMGEGNLFQRELIGPATERLLNLHPGESVLEIACGNGVFARRMAQLGAHVVATDFSERFIELARARSTEYADSIDYRVVDATNEQQLLALGKRHFDVAVCNMGLMDMATIEPLLAALTQLLKPTGRFVFSVMHPCFNTESKLMVEEEDRDGELLQTYSVKVSQYLNMQPRKGVGIPGQSVPHYYFHRPLYVLLNACFQAGFVLNGLEEPGFGEHVSGNRVLSWASFKDIPPVLVARCILPSY